MLMLPYSCDLSANVIDHCRSASLYTTWRHSLAASQLVRQHMRCDAWIYLSRGLPVHNDAWQHVGAASWHRLILPYAAFWKGWKLTLVMMSVLPLLALLGVAMGSMMAKLSTRASSAYGKANEIVQQVSARLLVAIESASSRACLGGELLVRALPFNRPCLLIAGPQQHPYCDGLQRVRVLSDTARPSGTWAQASWLFKRAGSHLAITCEFLNKQAGDHQKQVQSGTGSAPASGYPLWGAARTDAGQPHGCVILHLRAGTLVWR